MDTKYCWGYPKSRLLTQTPPNCSHLPLVGKDTSVLRWLHHCSDERGSWESAQYQDNPPSTFPSSHGVNRGGWGWGSLPQFYVIFCYLGPQALLLDPRVTHFPTVALFIAFYPSSSFAGNSQTYNVLLKNIMFSSLQDKGTVHFLCNMNTPLLAQRLVTLKAQLQTNTTL